MDESMSEWYSYEYLICQESNIEKRWEEFFKICKRIMFKFPLAETPYDRLFTEDDTDLKMFKVNGSSVIVYNDHTKGTVYVRSELILPFL